MSDEKPKSVHEKLDRLQRVLEKVADQVIKLDQNVIVVAGRLDAIEPELTSIKPSVTNLQAALVNVANDVHDIRQRLFEEAERVDIRFKHIEHPNGNGPTVMAKRDQDELRAAIRQVRTSCRATRLRSRTPSYGMPRR